MQAPRTEFVKGYAIAIAAMFFVGAITTVSAQEDAEEDEVIDEYLNRSKTLPKTALIFGMCDRTVSDILLRNNIQRSLKT